MLCAEMPQISSIRYNCIYGSRGPMKPTASQRSVSPQRRFSRRDFLKVSAILGFDTLLLGIAGFGYITRIEPTWVDVRHVSLRLPRLPRAFSGWRMAQLSDIHIGPWMTLQRVRELFEMAVSETPDALALTGDFVLTYGWRNLSYEDELGELAGLLAEYTRRIPVFAVLGNHDHWYNAAQVRGALEAGGVQVLSNAVSVLERGDARFYVAGVDDAYEGKDNLDAVLSQLPPQAGAILLSHVPDFADRSAATGRFDLQMSGHSHGGQVVLPFVGPPVLPKWGQKYVSGLYRVEGMFQYTNRGVGMTFPAVRFNCRPEITVFTLESGETD